MIVLVLCAKGRNLHVFGFVGNLIPGNFLYDKEDQFPIHEFVSHVADGVLSWFALRVVLAPLREFR